MRGAAIVRYVGILLLTFLPAPVVAQKAYVLKLKSTDGALLSQACFADTASAKKEEGDTTKDQLILQVRSKDDAIVASPTTLLVFIDHIPADLTTIQDPKELVRLEKAGDLDGRLIEVVEKDGDARVCSVVLGTKRSEVKQEGFTLYTGAELSSAQSNFSQTDTRVAASASWVLPLVVKRGFRLEFTPEMHLTSALKIDSRSSCSPGRTITAVGPNIPNLPPIATACGLGRVSGDTLFTVIPVALPVQYETAKSARVLGTFRPEWQIGRTKIWAGPAISTGFQTNPDADFDPNVGVFYMLGGTLSQLSAKDEHTVFRLDVMAGRAADFAVNTFTTKVINSDTIGTAKDTVITRAVFLGYRTRFQVRLLAEPVSGFFLRGFAQIGPGGPDLVQLAFLKDVDLSKIFAGIFK
ncbi:MAG: hypothetical protein ABJD11_11125 [Gemmatimonadota bacterium]